MPTDSANGPTGSLLVRLISHARSPWILLGIALVLVLAPIGALYADGILRDVFAQGHWRLIFLPAAVIVYILAVSPVMDRGEQRVVRAFRPLVQLGDQDYAQLVEAASRLNPIAEVAAFGLGAVSGLVISQSWISDSDAMWLGLYLTLAGCLMFGLLGWSIYAAVASTRLISELHRQPLNVDILDTRPFEPIGRQSLIIALVFVGGIVLAVVFGQWGSSIYDWRNWVFVLFLMLVPVLVFFLNMRDTHRVLATEKKRELEAVERNIRQACRTLMGRIEAEQSSRSLAAEISALAIYEKRVQAARTWPYDTAMLRTLFVSVIIPGATAFVQFASEKLRQ